MKILVIEIAPIAVRETSIRKPVDFLLISSENRLIVDIPFLWQRLSSSLRNRPLHSQSCFATRRWRFVRGNTDIGIHCQLREPILRHRELLPDPTIDRALDGASSVVATVSLRCQWKSDSSIEKNLLVPLWLVNINRAALVARSDEN